jgi:hypothetical protein
VSLKQRVRLELADGREIETTYSAVDLRAWETKFRKSSLTEDMSVSMLTWLGWHAARRQNQVDGDLTRWESFDAVCESVEGVRDEEPEDLDAPGEADTPTAPGGDSS